MDPYLYGHTHPLNIPINECHRNPKFPDKWETFDGIAIGDHTPELNAMSESIVLYKHCVERIGLNQQDFYPSNF